ncbi:hypothetical protein EDB19DRAFT_2035843 [Suillus lakei]|nr:hypothetical protein EDB19DRAFT_2035843 [Suillus lakei]
MPNVRLQRRSSSNPPRYPSLIRSYSYSNVPSELYHLAPNIHCNGGLKNTLDSVTDRMTSQLWVGTLGSSTDAYSTALKASVDLPDASKMKLFFESAAFKQYAAVNKRFAEAIESVWTEGDAVRLSFHRASFFWTNDYYLMLLPLLRQSTRVPALARAPIGFFMHVPFPSSEISRWVAFPFLVSLRLCQRCFGRGCQVLDTKSPPYHPSTLHPTLPLPLSCTDTFPNTFAPTLNTPPKQTQLRSHS